MDFIRVSEYIGVAGFILWAVFERGFSLFHQQQDKGQKQAQGSYWLISACWYGVILFSVLDVWNLKWTIFGTPLWILRGLGTFLITSGLVIRFLARLALGKQYSVHVETSDSHQLIRMGIYKVIRHPAYLGLLCLLLGIPLSMGSWGAIFLAVAGGIPAIVYRISAEEKLLIERFGNQYKQYKENTRRLLPYLW